MNSNDRNIRTLSNNGLYLGKLSEYFRDNADYVLTAIKQNPNALFYASERLKNNKNIVLAAVKKDPSVIYWAGKECQFDSDIERYLMPPRKIKIKYTRRFKKKKKKKKTRKFLS